MFEPLNETFPLIKAWGRVRKQEYTLLLQRETDSTMAEDDLLGLSGDAKIRCATVHQLIVGVVVG